MGLKLVLWAKTSPLSEMMQYCKKSLKMPKKGSSEAVNRRTDNINRQE